LTGCFATFSRPTPSMCFPESLPSLPNLAEIEELLRDAGLEHYWEPASAWCIEEGARFVDEIGENKNEFAKALALKRLEKIRLERALARAAAVKTASPLPGTLPVLSARPLVQEHFSQPRRPAAHRPSAGEDGPSRSRASRRVGQQRGEEGRGLEGRFGGGGRLTDWESTRPC